MTIKIDFSSLDKMTELEKTEKPQYKENKETIYSKESWKTNYKNFRKSLSPTVLTVYAVVGTSSA